VRCSTRTTARYKFNEYSFILTQYLCNSLSCWLMFSDRAFPNLLEVVQLDYVDAKSKLEKLFAAIRTKKRASCFCSESSPFCLFLIF